MKAYRKAFGLSLTIHLVLAMVLLGPSKPASKHYVVNKTVAAPVNQPIINTVAVDATKIDEQINRIYQQKQEKARLEKARQQAAMAELQKLQNQRRQEQQELLALKRKQHELASKQQAQLKKRQAQLKKLESTRAEREATLKNQQLELERQQKQLAALEEKLKQKAQLEAKKKEQARQERLKKEKEAEEQQKALLAKQAQQQALISAEVNKYKALIINAISANWILPADVDKHLSCRFEIHLAASGQVLDVKLLQTSGDPVLDRSAQTAIFRASPLPVPPSSEAFKLFKVVSLTVRPENLIN